VNIRPYFKLAKNLPSPARARATGTGPWAVPDLCAAYQFPKGNAAGGGTIAIVELGGGWTKPDMEAFFASIGQPEPTITDVSVDGTKNKPGGDADGEVALDIQVAAAAYFYATGQPAKIRVYWANDIAPGILAAVKDGCDVCSISWGADEAEWGEVAAQALEAAATQAVASGMVVFAASGDNDSSDGGTSAANVDLPAAAPHVIGCGGTNKTRSSETVWNNTPGQASGEGTGGGYSTLFAMPAWQATAHAPKGPGKLVPDLAACADPETGYQIYFGGQAEVVGGTSAVAPLYAGLFAALGRKLGFVAPALWADPGAFTDITQGDNGQYHAAIGPDPCTGLGAPVGVRIAAALASSAPAPSPSPTPTPGPTPAPPPPAVTVDQAIAWAEARLPHVGFISAATARAAIAAGLKKSWPTT
jgi:kumamolisin